MKTISIKVPEELDLKLTGMARERGASRSAVFRAALETFARGEKESVAARAQDLAGCLSGPNDLSTSTKHMVGYGE